MQMTDEEAKREFEDWLFNEEDDVNVIKRHR